MVDKVSHELVFFNSDFNAFESIINYFRSFTLLMNARLLYISGCWIHVDAHWLPVCLTISTIIFIALLVSSKTDERGTAIDVDRTKHIK